MRSPDAVIRNDVIPCQRFTSEHGSEDIAIEVDIDSVFHLSRPLWGDDCGLLSRSELIGLHSATIAEA